MTQESSRLSATLAAFATASVLTIAPNAAFAQTDEAGPVLDLREAATLLRVEPDALRELADAGRVPARRVGDTWRFARDALLEWLKGERFAGMAIVPPSPGTNAPAAAARVAASQPTATAPPTVGERPSAQTAADVALRDQRVLLPRGSASLDLGMSYARSEQTLYPVVRVEQSTAGANATLRYGVVDDRQVALRLPAVWRGTKTFADASLVPASVVTRTNDRFAGDPSISLIGVGVRENTGRPNLLWSVDAVLPGGSRDRGIGGGLVLSKSYDPAVIFAGINYLRGLSVDAADPRRSLARNNAGFSLGYTYALNDTLALSTLLTGAWRDARSPDGVAIPPARERYQLQFGMTWQLAPGLFMEPSAAVRVGGDRPDMTLSLNVPYRFN